MPVTPGDVCPAILAGGLGTRLRPAVGRIPKVLAPVGGRPFLAYLLDQLADAGFDEAVLLVGYGAAQLREAFGERYGQLRLTYSAEPEPLGTGGAVRLALPHFGGRPVLLLNGDSYCEVELHRLLAFHTTHAGRASLCVAEVPDAARYGRVNCATDGQVVRFEEKQSDGSPCRINAGVYLLDAALVEAIPAGRAVSLEREMLPAWTDYGEVYGFAGTGRFIDIGVPESYHAAGAFFRVGKPRSVCMVCSCPEQIDATDAALHTYREAGWQTHLLCCTNGDHGFASGSPPDIGIRLHSLADFDLAADYRVGDLYGAVEPDRSDRVRLALEHLHRKYRFDRIEFPVGGGLGFRAVQAKRAGLAFDGVTLAARLDSCRAREREQARRWPTGFEEVEAEYAERFAFEYADERVTHDPDVLAFVRRKGWVTEPGPVPTIQTRFGDPVVTVGIAHYNLGRFLPATLASLDVQTYPHLDVVVIDDGSTDPDSLHIFEEMAARYPRWRFLRQPNAGIGATRNRCLELARGEFFLPVDADNLARPEMVERFVRGMLRNPDLAAMTCYHLAFAGDGDRPEQFLFACRPTGGPHALAAVRNVYGDANAIFRTEALRDVGGYETDRGTSNEDWELFVKLVHAGGRVGVIPQHLFYYRHRDAGFSRTTNWFANHQRVLRQFTQSDRLPAGEAEVLWTALLGFHQQLERLKGGPACRRHRVADAVYAAVKSVPRAVRQFVRGKATSRRPSS
jgi:dTDP-glucose pyrophosphorylase/GT2 family glycosyltransferase